MTNVILVDEHDCELGYMDKVDAHIGDGSLHRAFSVFVVRSDNRILLQKRAADKMLWPEHWSNSCCSHPAPGESILEAAQRRLTEELNIGGEIFDIFSIIYSAKYKQIGIECELCHVLVAFSDETPTPHQSEVADFVYLTPNEIDLLITGRQINYTPWFAMEWQKIRSQYPFEFRSDALTATV